MDEPWVEALQNELYDAKSKIARLEEDLRVKDDRIVKQRDLIIEFTKIIIELRIQRG